MSKTDLTYIQDTQTLVGTKRKELIDTESGELITVDQITKRVYGSRSFWKMYLMDFLMVLGIIDSKQVDIFIYVVENTNQSTNLFIGTYKKIADDVGCSQTTIAKIFKKLQANNFIKRVQSGVWFVNPNILMRGDEHKRQILLSYYESEEPIDSLTLSRTKRKQITNEVNDNGEREASADTAELAVGTVNALPCSED